jgi:Lon-like ATP-dependent protease
MLFPLPLPPSSITLRLLTLYQKQNIKEGIEGKPVAWYNEVFELVFPGVDAKAANSMWKQQLKKEKKEKREKEDKDKEYDSD